MSANEPLQFVDTSILVYAYDRLAGPKHALAKTLVQKLWENKVGCISVQVLQELYVCLTRKSTSPVESALAAQIISDLCTWQMHVPNGSDVLGAISLQQQYQLAFWDAMIIHSAAESGCALVFSEDFSAGRIYQGVEVVNPFAQT